MPETWPVALQEYLDSDSFTFGIGETAIETPMDVGPKKKRRIFTKPVNSISCSIFLSQADYDTFDTFFNTTLGGGVNTFNFTHPLKGILREFRMVGTPKMRHIGGGTYNVVMDWIELP